MKTLTMDFSTVVKMFFKKFLPVIKGVSPNTIQSYRDSIKLLMLFVSQNKKPIHRLQIEDFSSETILDFLNHLEKDSHNSVTTRNIRLAGIHAFFRYVASAAPEHLSQCLQIINIPYKHGIQREVEYFTFEEIESILQNIELKTWRGKRDHALLLLMFNTGARAQEVVDIQIKDLHLERPYSVDILGKGRKERTCPLWCSTIASIKRYLADGQRVYMNESFLFSNSIGISLTRFGIRYILKKRIEDTKEKVPSLGNKKLHPHSMRHSTGVYLLKSGNELSSIANWLGHASIDTTNRYATMDIEMKQKVLEKMTSPVEKIEREWPTEDIIRWMEDL